MGLDGSTCSECLPERTCHFQPPAHVPLTSAGAKTCEWGPGRLLVCHGAESTKKNPRPKENKLMKDEKSTLIYMYKVPRRNVGDVKSQGLRKLIKKDTKETQQ